MDFKFPDCFTCNIVSSYVDLANVFTQDLGEALIGPMWLLFLALVGVWVVMRGLQLGMGQTTMADVAKEFLYVLIAGFLLAGQGPELVETVFTVSLSMMGSAASVALAVGGNSDVIVPAAAGPGGTIPLDTGMVALVQAAEDGVGEVFELAKRIMKSTTMMDWTPAIYGLLLMVPYFMVLVVYFAQIVIAIFRIMMLATLSPFLMLGFAFNWGRDMTKSAFRTMISAFLVLFGATAALAVMLYGVTSLGIGGMADESIRDMASITNQKFLLAMAMGIMGTAFMTEATGMANSIAGSSLTNTSAGVITAGATVAAVALAKNPASRFFGGSAAGMATGGASFVASKGMQGAGYAAGAAAQTGQALMEKFKSYGQ